MKAKTIFNRALSLLMSAALLCGMLCLAPTALKASAAGLPTVSYQGLTLDSGTTTDENLPLLVQNPNGRDFDFFPDKDAMAEGNTWFEYDFGSTVEFTGVEMVGWWPTQQAVNKVSFQFFDGEWKDSDQEVVPQWTTTGSGPDTLKIDLSTPVSGTKFRIKVLGTNTTWSAKCCMRLLAPVTSETSRLKLEAALANANKAKDEAVPGTEAGQYPQDAYDAFAEAIADAQALLDNGATAAEYEKAAEVLASAQAAFAETIIIAGKLSEPEVTLVNLNAQSGSPQLLVNNPGRGDFDFGPGGSDMSSQNAYVEYNYVDIVEINAVDLIGWWPKDQAVKNISFEYYKDGAWVQADQDIEVAWKTPANTGKEEELTVELANPVTTTKFRVKINATYHSWSSKINMRLMEPKGTVIRSIKPLYDAVRSAQDYVDSVLIGNKPGEFPQSAVDALQAVVSEAISKLDDPNLTEEELQAQIDRVEAAKETFIKSQNPVSGVPEVTLEGLTLKGGSLSCLVDGQVSTETILSEYGALEGAYLVFDYGTEVYRLSELSVLASNPTKSAPSVVSIEYFTDGEWKTAAENVDLGWKGTIPNVEGRNVVLSAPVEASKFRVQILETNTDKKETRINEILLKGRVAADLTDLNALAEKAESLLSEADGTVSPALLDIVAISLSAARDTDLLSRASQARVDELKADLQAAVDEVEAADTELARAALITKLQSAKAIQKEGYTTESYEALQTAIAAAQTVVDNDSATVAELEAQISALETAVNQLVRVDKSTLEIVISLADAHVKNHDIDSLVPSAKEQFETTLQKAEAILADGNATQEQVDQAWKDLMKAIQGLSFQKGDKTELIKLIAVMEGVNPDAYEDGVQKDAFVQALSDAQAVVDDADALASDVTAAMNTLQSAFDALIPLSEPGDKTELKKMIDVGKAYDLTEYVDDANKTNFEAVLKQAEDLYENNDRATQKEIDDMRLSLANAMEKLRFRADKSTLEKWLERLNAIDLTGYSEEVVRLVQEAVSNAGALMGQDLGTDQNALIQAAVDEMEAAYARLQAEKPTGPDSSSSETPSDNSSHATSDDTSSGGKPATTGDSAPIAAVSALALAAAGAVLFLKKRASR